MSQHSPHQRRHHRLEDGRGGCSFRRRVIEKRTFVHMSKVRGEGVGGRVLWVKSSFCKGFDSSYRLAWSECGWRKICHRFQGFSGGSLDGMRPSYRQYLSVHGSASGVWRVQGTRWIEDHWRIGSSVASVELSRIRIPLSRLSFLSWSRVQMHYSRAYW